jgi:hypothetical protein
LLDRSLWDQQKVIDLKFLTDQSSLDISTINPRISFVFMKFLMCCSNKFESRELRADISEVSLVSLLRDFVEQLGYGGLYLFPYTWKNLQKREVYNLQERVEKASSCF